MKITLRFFQNLSLSGLIRGLKLMKQIFFRIFICICKREEQTKNYAQLFSKIRIEGYFYGLKIWFFHQIGTGEKNKPNSS